MGRGKVKRVGTEIGAAGCMRVENIAIKGIDIEFSFHGRRGRRKLDIRIVDRDHIVGRTTHQPADGILAHGEFKGGSSPGGGDIDAIVGIGIHDAGGQLVGRGAARHPEGEVTHPHRQAIDLSGTRQAVERDHGAIFDTGVGCKSDGIGNAVDGSNGGLVDGGLLIDHRVAIGIAVVGCK